MKILVDADACPVKDIIVREAKKRNISVVMIADTNHEIADGYSEVVIVDQGADSADWKLINLTKAGDLVITQDFGVGAMAIGKGAYAMTQNGMAFTDSNMDQLLFERHLGKTIRRKGGRTSGVRKRSDADNEAFKRELCLLLDQHQ